MTRDAERFLPLRRVELEVLLSTVDRARHGYAILQETEQRNGGRSSFEIPTLYRALRRMREAGLIQPAPAPGEDVDARRDYWQTTPLGREVLLLELRRLEALVSAGRTRTRVATERGVG